MPIDKTPDNTIDIDKFNGLLQPVSDTMPSGKNLELDSDYLFIKQHSESKPSGFAKNDPKPTQWHEVYDRCQALLKQSKDLNILLWLCRASLNIEGLIGLAQSLLLCHHILDQYWDSLYPNLDSEDNNDPTERINCLLFFNEPTGFLHDLQQTPLLQNKVAGSFVLGEYLNSENTLDDNQAIAKLNEIYQCQTLAESQKSIDAIQSILKIYHHIRQLITDRVGNPCHCSLEQFEYYIQKIHFLIQSTTIAREIAPTLAAGNRHDQAPPTDKKNAAPLSIQNRTQVIQALDLITQYYERNEPSSPIPLLINRAKKMIDMNFIDIITELAPQGLNEARAISGIE